MRRGFIAALRWVAIYTSLVFALVTYLKGRVAIAVTMAFLFAHFTASAGWLVYRYRFGVSGLHVYSFVVGAVFVLCCASGSLRAFYENPKSESYASQHPTQKSG